MHAGRCRCSGSSGIPLERRYGSPKKCLTPILLLLCWWVSPLNAAEKSLYKPEDGLLELDVNTFDSAIYNQPTAFIVEFYSSWCGHCISYAPKYVEFAKLLKPWKSVVVTAVLNCADEANAPTCRHHKIDAFPTLKYFKVWSKTQDDSIRYTGNKEDLPEFSLFVAEMIKADFDNSRPVTWPNYEVIPDTQTAMSDLWTAKDASLLCILVESDPIKNAFALITNYAEEHRVHVVAMRPSHPIALRFSNVKVPAIHIFSRRNPEQVIYSENKPNWLEMKTKVEELLQLEPPPLQQQIQQPISDEKQKKEHGVVAPSDTTRSVWTQHEVQLLDLQKTLLYMLSVEVPRNPYIRGKELDALRGWIHLLRKYAPGTTPMRRLFYRLDDWLKRHEMATEITADEWIKAVENIQSNLGHPLPAHPEYMACRGSEPKFRGYTCGLWTLFHTITVQAYKEEMNNVNFKPYNDVLEPIHQFVVQFLSCETCAKHFDQMTRDRNMAGAQRPEHVVLWLWSAHNTVNKRLSGDATDDPKFPKHQFPPPAICSHCYVAGSSNTFDENATFDFLLKYYSNIKLDGITDQSAYEMKKFENGKLETVANRRLNPKFVGMAGKVDKMEEAENRLYSIRQETGPKREWRNFDGSGFVSDPSFADRKTFYLLWFVVAGILLSLAYFKYRQNRSKFWKTFYYYSDYKL